MRASIECRAATAPMASIASLDWGRSRGSNVKAASSPTRPRMMLIKKTGRQSSPPMLAEMMKPAAIVRGCRDPMAGPNALTARGNCGLEKEVMRMLIPWES